MIQELLDFYHPNLKAAVCAKDQLFTFKPRRKAYVVNTDPISKKGQHWVCIYYENNIGYYFDSYGISNAIEPEINGFLKATCRHSYRNVNRFQSDYSDYCGLYCLFALHAMTSQKASFNKLSQRTFSATNWLDNDRHILHWFRTRKRGCAHAAKRSVCQTCAARSSGGATLRDAL